MTQPALARRSRLSVSTLVPQFWPALAAVLTGLLARRVFLALRGPALEPLSRELPGRTAALVAAGAERPWVPAACLGAVPLVLWLAVSIWAAGVPGVSRSRARQAVGWAWLSGALAAAVALLAGVHQLKTGLAALGYAVAWPALAGIAVALHLRRAGAWAFSGILSACGIAALLLRLVPLGWPTQNSWSWWAMWPALPWETWAAGLAWIAGGWLLLLAMSRLESRGARRAAVAGLALVALCFARGFPLLEHYGAGKHPAALASRINTSFFQMAGEVRDPAAFLRRFSEESKGFPMHGATHPPGWPLLFRCALDAGATAPGAAVANGVAAALGADPAASGALAGDVAGRPLAPGEAEGLWLLVGLGLLGLLTLPAATYFTARAHEAPRVAYRAAGVVAVLAAPLLFFPDVDVLYPTLAMLAAGAWLRSERRGGEAWALLAGACLAAELALTYGALPLYLVCALQALLSARRRQALTGHELRRGAALLLPAALLVGAGAAAGHNALAAFGAAMAHHREILAGRSAPLWMALNPLDLVVLMGIPVAAWLARATPWWHHPGAARRLRMDPESALFGGTLLTLAALDLASGTKGEAGRLWMPFMPLLVAGGAALWRERRRAEWACITGLNLITLCVLKGFYVFVWLYS